MGVHETVFLITAILASFGVFYLFFTTRHRERMGMIDKGIAPHKLTGPMDHPLRALKNGLLLIGAGLGLMVGFFFDRNVIAGEYDSGPLPYFVGMSIFGGLALVLFYFFFGRKQQG